jgi:hypothetical protein
VRGTAAGIQPVYPGMARPFATAAVGVGAVVAMSACGSAQPEHPGGARGTLTGRVVTGPVCPVEQNPPRAACRPRPLPAAHVAVTSAGHTVATADTDRSGRFVVELPYGTYLVTATNPGPLPSTARRRVRIGQRPATVRLLVDAGIR